jgi:CHASE2 domain-containing sensor protein
MKDMMILISMLVAICAISWLYASSSYALDGRFEIDLIGSFLSLLFSAGIVISLLAKSSHCMPDGWLSRKDFSKKLDSTITKIG